MVDAERQEYLLRQVVAYIHETKDMGVTVFYDGAVCDGYCLIDDLRAEFPCLATDGRRQND